MHNNLRRLISAYLAGEPGAHPTTTATELLTRAFAALGGPVDESRDPRKPSSVEEAAIVTAIVERIVNEWEPPCADGSCSLESPLGSPSSSVSPIVAETPDGSKTE